MALTKHEIPILEFDADTHAVIAPTHEGLDMKLPRKCVFPFLGGHVEKYAQLVGARQVGEFISATRHFPVYVLRHAGEEVAMCPAPVGAAPAAQLLDWLMGYGAREIVSAGSCGCLEEFPEGTFLVPRKALRDEGTSYHYAPPSRYMEIDVTARKAIMDTLKAHGLTGREVVTWSTDGFYRETREKVAYRRGEGCSVVEMECAALAACAAFRGAKWGMLLYTADSLADMEQYDERNWGGGACEYALRLCLDAVLRMKED